MAPPTLLPAGTYDRLTPRGSRVPMQGCRIRRQTPAHLQQPQDEPGFTPRPTLRELTKLRGEVCLCAPGSLPADGKIIADERSLA